MCRLPRSAHAGVEEGARGTEEREASESHAAALIGAASC